MFTKAQRIFQKIANRLKAPEFRTAHSQRPEDFSRQRKVGFMEVIAILLNRLDRTSEVEVQRFCDRHLPKVDRYTKRNYSGDHVRVVDPKNNSGISWRLEVSCSQRS